jgi:acetyl-CoA C-acetyltransferase
MLKTLEMLRPKYSIARAEQDEYAARSHKRAAAAAKACLFVDEIVPASLKGRKADVLVDTDEHVRPDSSVEVLARLDRS